MKIELLLNFMRRKNLRGIRIQAIPMVFIQSVCKDNIEIKLNFKISSLT